MNKRALARLAQCHWIALAIPSHSLSICIENTQMKSQLMRTQWRHITQHVPTFSPNILFKTRRINRFIFCIFPSKSLKIGFVNWNWPASIAPVISWRNHFSSAISLRRYSNAILRWARFIEQCTRFRALHGQNFKARPTVGPARPVVNSVKFRPGPLFRQRLGNERPGPRIRPVYGLADLHDDLFMLISFHARLWLSNLIFLYN